MGAHRFETADVATRVELRHELREDLAHFAKLRRRADVARELASALGMRYVFANSHLVLAPGDSAEQDHGQENALALHGNALLSRFPIRRFEAVTLPEYQDKFHALEKRLGEKRALLADV